MIDPQENLKAFLDGELAPVEMDEMRALMASDPFLSAQAEDFKLITQSFAAEPQIEPVGLEDTLKELALRRSGANRWSWIPRFAGGLAVVGGAAVLLLFASINLSGQAKVAAKNVSYASQAAIAAEREEQSARFYAPKSAAPVASAAAPMGDQSEAAAKRSAMTKAIAGEPMSVRDQVSLGQPQITEKSGKADTSDAFYRGNVSVVNLPRSIQNLKRVLAHKGGRILWNSGLSKMGTASLVLELPKAVSGQSSDYEELIGSLSAKAALYSNQTSTNHAGRGTFDRAHAADLGITVLSPGVGLMTARVADESRWQAKLLRELGPSSRASGAGSVVVELPVAKGHATIRRLRALGAKLVRPPVPPEKNLVVVFAPKS